MPVRFNRWLVRMYLLEGGLNRMRYGWKMFHFHSGPGPMLLGRGPINRRKPQPDPQLNFTPGRPSKETRFLPPPSVLDAVRVAWAQTMTFLCARPPNPPVTLRFPPSRCPLLLPTLVITMSELFELSGSRPVLEPAYREPISAIRPAMHGRLAETARSRWAEKGSKTRHISAGQHPL